MRNMKNFFSIAVHKAGFLAQGDGWVVPLKTGARIIKTCKTKRQEFKSLDSDVAQKDLGKA